LLENALKFTPEGGRITLRVRRDGDDAILEVEDTGIGISEEALPDIFDAFKQESEGLDREYEGSGLGLSNVRKLTDLLGGSIDVESEKGHGTCFTVRLPTEEAD
jgi:signal transduction histidine kinase